MSERIPQLFLKWGQESKIFFIEKIVDGRKVTEIGKKYEVSVLAFPYEFRIEDTLQLTFLLPLKDGALNRATADKEVFAIVGSCNPLNDLPLRPNEFLVVH